MELQLTNIANCRRDIFLFKRDDKGTLKIDKIDNFFPYFYEEDEKGQFLSYNNTKLRKVFCSQPSDIPKMRSFSSYSADIKYTNNFLIQKVDKILPTTIKFCFIDIEILAESIPSVLYPKHPVSCISIYNSFSKDIHTWFLPEQKAINQKEQEKLLFRELINYLKKEKPDIILGWNASKFDYPYLYNRAKEFKIDFAREISPIYSVRGSEEKDILYPNGISIVDYLTLFKKVYMREASYALDYIGEKHLGRGKEFKNVDFSKLDTIIKKRNIGDVVMLADLESKYKLIPYYDEVRRMAKCTFEDLYYNSRIVEMFLFEEAKLKNVVLPNRQVNNTIEETDEPGFEGATRNIEKTGLYNNIGKFDLTSAYPNMIINFCLDTSNISEVEGTNINGIRFKQDSNAILPSTIKKILILKDRLKKERKANPEDKLLQTKYDAIKAITNSFWGVIGSPYFRLFNVNIASIITFLVREVLMYVKHKVEKEGLKVIYYDTDSLMINTKEDISKKLNQYVQDWGKEKYNKESIDLKFDYEGYFTSLFILGSCHYYGRIFGKKAPEIRGIEAKRSSSTKYEAKFQEELLNKVLDGEEKTIIDQWLNEEQERIKTLSISEIAFPCKIASKDYKAYPIFVRAKDNTLKIKKDFKLNVGELFYYIFVRNNYEVLAFTEDDNSFIDRKEIDYDRIMERNIFNKAERIYGALGWYLQKNLNQKALF